MLIPDFLQKLVLLPVLALFAFVAQAQPMPATGPDILPEAEQNCGLTLSGKVLDHDNREPLIGATVLIRELKRAAVADEYGNYHFHDICQGTYTVQVSYIGYEQEAFTFRITTSSVRDLQLHTDTRTLNTVQVIGSHVKSQAQSSELLGGRDLAEARGLTLAESLKSIAGVTTLQTGPTISKPVIHGLHGSRILLLNNGVRQEAQQWGTEHAPEIDPFVATEMHVIKGAAGVRYGADAIGGVVIVEPKPLPDSAGMAGSLNLMGSTNNRQGVISAMVEGNVAKLRPLSWRLQGTLKKGGFSKAKDYYLNNTAFEEQNFSGTVGYTKQNYGAEVYYSLFQTKLGILRESHVGSSEDLLNAINRDKPFGADTVKFTYDIRTPYQDVTHHLLKTRLYLNSATAGKFEFVYGLQQNVRQEYALHGNSAATPAMQLKLTTHTTEAVWEHKPIGNFSGSIGAATVYKHNTYKYDDFLPQYTGITAGAFAIEKWQKDRLQLEGGLRYDYTYLLVKKYEPRTDNGSGAVLIKPDYTFHNLSGMVGGMYDVGYHLTFGLSATSAWRAPGANELFSEGIHHSSVAYEVGNPNLKPEQAYNFEASVDYYANRRFNAKLSVYNNYINEYIYTAIQPEPELTVRGSFLKFLYKQADASFRGADLSFDLKLVNKLTWISKSFVVRARNLDIDDWLVAIPADRTDNKLTFEAGDVGKQLKETYFSLGGLFVARQTRMPTKADEDLAEAPDAYFLVHAEAGTTLYFGKQPLEIGITANNLLNTAYRDYLNRFRYFADETGRLIMFRVSIPLDFRKS